MVLLGVQFAHLLTALLAVSVLLLGLWAVCRLHAQVGASRRPVPAVVARQSARRAIRRQVAFDATPLPSRDPPRRFPPAAVAEPGSPDAIDFGRPS